MTTNQRGTLIFLIIVGAAVLFCWFVPFVLLPSIDAAMALPVIQLPGEILIKDVPLIENFTNTAVGLLITDVLVILIALSLRNPKMVPTGFQNLFEMIVGYLHSLTKQIVGAHKAPKIFPLVASIFLFVLVANWIELVPGVDSIGLIHCAEDGMAGYPVQVDESEAPFEDGLFGNPVVALKIEEAGKAGDIATEEDYHACEAKWFGHTEEGHGDEGDAAHDAADEGDHDADEDTPADTEGAAEVEGAVDGEGHAADEEHVVNPDLLVVTPFVRAAATDLNMTLSLALIAFLAIQYFGVQELGLMYFAKFINLPALGNLSKKPMGVMDFAVGLLEIVSELSKILSFGFRLFGNIFAGQVLLFVIPFLVATLMPAGVYGLELFVGLIQAFVFFMLTLVFSGMAMEGHHGDDDEHH